MLRGYTIPSLLETFQFLEKKHPQYLFYSPFYNVLMTAVPHQYITMHYKPEERLSRLLKAKRLDRLQKKAKRLVSFLAKRSGIKHKFFGVTGSILLNIHRLNLSDIDITVYGLKNSLAVKRTLLESRSMQNSTIRRLEGSALKAWCRAKTRSYPLTQDEAIELYRRRWNIGLFEETQFSVHPVKLEKEIHERYADKTYEPVGSVVAGAVVSEGSDSMFLPSIYRVREVKVIKGPQVSDIEEIVSYEGLYADLAEVEETILVKGKLEQVRDKRIKQMYHRIVVGSPEGKGTEYIKPLT